MKTQIRLFRAIQKIISSVCFALLLLSCVGFKSIVPESTGSVSGALSSLATGDLIVAKMRNRDLIKMKVVTVDSLKIAGIHRFMNSKGEMMRLDTIIMVQDIQSIRKRKFSAERTIGLVVIIAAGSLILNVAGPYMAML